MRLAHVSWNFGGLAFPLAIAAATVPQLLKNLGPERFGVLTLAWGLIGYAAALDLGVGRAVTQRVATLRAERNADVHLIATSVRTALVLAMGLGLLGGGALAIASFTGGGALINAANIPSYEIMYSGLLLAIALPMQSISATYRGVNEAYLNFRGISVVRLLLGAANFGIPYLISGKSQSLILVIGGLVTARGAGMLVYANLANRCLKTGGANIPARFSPKVSRELFSFGGWFAVSNILNSCLAVSDRFVIAAAVSAAAAAIYVVPYEFVVQSLIVVGAITTVAFPYFSSLRASNPKALRPAFWKGLGAAVGAMALISVCFLTIGPKILAMWLGGGYRYEHGQVMKILATGLVPYAAGTMCISYLHAMGATKLTAKINVIEFAFYLSLLFLMIQGIGIVGAAWAWVIRVSINAVTLLICSLSAK